MIGLPALYAVTGAMFAAFALLALTRRRWGNAAFWGLVALGFVAGDAIGDIGNGLIVLALAVLAGTGALRPATPATTRAEARAAAAARYGNRLFAAALIVPATALVGTLALPATGLFDPKQVTLVSLAIGAMLALALGVAWLRPSPLGAIEDGARLMDSVGWAGVLPQALAALGALFAVAGVGTLVGDLAAGVLPRGSLVAAVAAYTIGMAGLTMVMGNAFAAFPVMTGAIGLPLLVRGFGGDPAPICALGMLSGFCGTMLTPMAANFNIVPTALLDLDRYAVIRAQAPTAILLLAVNTLLMLGLAFR